MEKYETPIMEVIDFTKNVRTSDIVVDSVIDKGDNNNPMVGPW